MQARFPVLRREDGFTLPELIIGIVIVGGLMGAIGGALIVSLRTTDVTSARFSESHDTQIASAYLAKDVQSASGGVAQPPTSANCNGAGTRLVGFNYSTSGNDWACYYYRVSGGQTQVTRSYVVGGALQTIVIAHFAAVSGPPIVTCSPSACSATTSSPDRVSIAFTELSGYQYTLLGSRRMAHTGSVSNPPQSPALTLLATGSSPLWVHGGCNGSNCLADTPNNSLPISDVAGNTTGWTPTPLYPNLNDGSDDTWVVNNLGDTIDEGRVNMASVAPPLSGVAPTIGVRAMVANGATGAEKLKLTLYEGNTRLANQAFTITSTIADYSYPLCLTSGCGSRDNAPNRYDDLSIGFRMSLGANTANINVYGVSLDTAGAFNSVLTVNGNVRINSTLSNAVRLSGSNKTTMLKIVDVGSGGGFGILDPGRCSGCTHQTVDCAACTWQTPTQPWDPFSPAIPDPLRFMASPPAAPLHTSCSVPNGYTSCYNPGDYPSLNFNAGEKAWLNAGIYILENGMSVNGGATVDGQHVMFYNKRGGSITINGGASVNLTAYDAYPYKNILIFQARCPGDNPTGCGNENTNAVNLTGGTVVNGSPGTLASFLGIVYAPASSSVTLGSGGANMRVTVVVAQNLEVTGGSFVTIG
jgi:prepilin-type N-terminal cleavage/methylation domain-containing protein